eukprot:scaffold18740_cov84-Isochrysis_galbana.AAC.1
MDGLERVGGGGGRSSHRDSRFQRVCVRNLLAHEEPDTNNSRPNKAMESGYRGQGSRSPLDFVGVRWQVRNKRQHFIFQALEEYRGSGAKMGLFVSSKPVLSTPWGWALPPCPLGVAWLGRRTRLLTASGEDGLKDGSHDLVHKPRRPASPSLAGRVPAEGCRAAGGSDSSYGRVPDAAGGWARWG